MVAPEDLGVWVQWVDALDDLGVQAQLEGVLEDLDVVNQRRRSMVELIKQLGEDL